MGYYTMFVFVNKVLVSAMTFFGCNLSNLNPLKFVLMSNQQCTERPEIININSNEPSSYPYSVTISKFSGSCNNINVPYPKMCILDVVQT